MDSLATYAEEYLRHHPLCAYDLAHAADFFNFQLLGCNYFHQVQFADAQHRDHVLDITLWATKICRTLSEKRHEIGLMLAKLA